MGTQCVSWSIDLYAFCYSYLARLRRARLSLYVVQIIHSFFLTVLLKTDYLRIDTYMGGHDHSELLFAISQGTLLYGNRFWREWAHSLDSICIFVIE